MNWSWRPGAWVALLVMVWSISASALAQSARDRQAAADAFDRGSAAYLAEDYEVAARWFEMANNLAPAAPALLQAIRAHQESGNKLRAGTLALRLIANWPDSNEVVDAQEAIDAAREDYFYIEVSCDADCAVDLGDTLMSHPAFFVAPDTEHNVGAEFDSGRVSETVQGAAGEQRALHFERPEGPAVATPPQGSETIERPNGVIPDEVPDENEGGGGISPAFFITSLALTLGAGAVLVWSGLDTLSINDDYEDAAAEERAAGQLDFPRSNRLLDDGQSAETRTNALIGVTAGLGAITVLLAILTDWGGSGEEDTEDGTTFRLQPSLGVSHQGGGVGLRGAF
ncbi:MAG: hypothetical protein AAGE52_33950 [Myxococcota bacterium]